MSLKSNVVYQIALIVANKLRKDAKHAIARQRRIMRQLVRGGKRTVYGKEHRFKEIKDYETFKANVPITNYEDLLPYIYNINAGKRNVLWRGRPKYYAKTSGTTSGAKFIPLTVQSIPNHFSSARNAVFNYMARTGETAFMDGKMIFLSGSPILEEHYGIPSGRLSGISNHLVPRWLKGNQMPSYETNCIGDWEKKLNKIVEETVNEDLRLISGIPPWVQMYYERLLDYTGKKTILDIFPNFSMFVYGGVNFEPYRAKLESLVGGEVPSLETYPASEGFLAFQDHQDDEGLLLNVNSGIFFEFIPVEEYFSMNPTRLWLDEVEVGVDYALILNTNAGLWGYSIGDTVRFVSKDPYKILVTGRIKHFISAFGEHVIGKEVETALLEAANKENIRINEFTVAPQVNPPNKETPYHEWFIAFDNEPANLEAFANAVDANMQIQNSYYKDLIDGGMLQTLKISPLAPDAFRKYMKSIGKLGGQNKVPRLSNDRKIADFLSDLG